MGLLGMLIVGTLMWMVYDIAVSYNEKRGNKR